MDYKRRISEITARAKALKVPVGELTRKAKVNPSTWYRWQQPDANIMLRKFNQACARMDAVLDAIEADMIEAIVARRQAAREAAE